MTDVEQAKKILLEGPSQVLSWTEFKSICKFFDDEDWFDICEVSSADLANTLQLNLPCEKLKDLATEFQISKETLNCLVQSNVSSVDDLKELTEDDVQHLKIPMGQKRRIMSAVSKVLTKEGKNPVKWESFKAKTASINTNIDHALGDHPKFWADHMNNSKLIKLL